MPAPVTAMALVPAVTPPHPPEKGVVIVTIYLLIHVLVDGFHSFN
jgi:hypothetical protein